MLKWIKEGRREGGEAVWECERVSRCECVGSGDVCEHRRSIDTS